MIRLFTGYDRREAIGWHVFCDSLMAHASEPVAIIPLQGQQKDGTNAFTYSRFLVPKLCEYHGWAIFADGCDMLLRVDIADLWAMRDDRYAVQVVKHDYRTRHPRKYVGTDMEAGNQDYPRKNWSSLILWNCARNTHLDPEGSASYLHRFQWLEDAEIGELPIEWNWLTDEYDANDDAKLVHWTAGIPGFPYYSSAPHSDEWRLTQAAKF